MSKFTADDAAALQKRVDQNAIIEGAFVPRPPAPNKPEKHPKVLADMARGTLVPRKSTKNKSEADYGLVLEAEKRAGRILDYRFEGITLKLGDDCRLTPDYYVLDQDGYVQFHDVKAFFKNKNKVWTEDDFQAKYRAACTIFPHFQFRTVWRENGQWRHKTY